MIRLAVDAYAFHPHSALRNLHEAAQQIQGEGFHDIPAWIALLQGSQPVDADADNAEPMKAGKAGSAKAVSTGIAHSTCTSCLPWVIRPRHA